MERRLGLRTCAVAPLAKGRHGRVAAMLRLQENGKTGASGKTRARTTTAMAVIAVIASTAMTTKVRRGQVDPRMVLADLLISTLYVLPRVKNLTASFIYFCTFPSLGCKIPENTWPMNSNINRFHTWPMANEHHSGTADWSKASRSRSAPRGWSIEQLREIGRNLSSRKLIRNRYRFMEMLHHFSVGNGRTGKTWAMTKRGGCSNGKFQRQTVGGGLHRSTLPNLNGHLHTAIVSTVHAVTHSDIMRHPYSRAEPNCSTIQSKFTWWKATGRSFAINYPT